WSAWWELYGGTEMEIAAYQERGLFQGVDWARLAPARIKPDYVEGGGRALRFMTFLPGINYNVKAAPWVPQVASVADLLKPEYKGKFVTTPFLAGFDVLLASPQ